MVEPYYVSPDGAITIYYGDCREVIPTLGTFDALVTDPPYGLGAIMQGSEIHWPLWEGCTQDGLPWDSKAPEYIPVLVTRAHNAIVWGGNYFALPPARGVRGGRRASPSGSHQALRYASRLAQGEVRRDCRKATCAGSAPVSTHSLASVLLRSYPPELLEARMS